MKTIKLLTLISILLLANTGNAQVSVSVNIGSPPMWAPYGYSSVRYYYLPDVEAYYDVESSMFIYIGNGGWIRRSYLPSRYRDYNLYSGYKVVMTDYHGNAPYSFYNQHRIKYKKGYHGAYQKTIREQQGHGNKSGNHNSGNGSSNRSGNGTQMNQGSSHQNGSGNGHGSGNSGKGKKK